MDGMQAFGVIVAGLFVLGTGILGGGSSGQRPGMYGPK